MDKTLSVPDLEAFYDALAEGVGRATPARSELFLAKLALLLAREVADRPALERCIAAALRDLSADDDAR
jgi:hypothetical protein